MMERGQKDNEIYFVKKKFNFEKKKSIDKVKPKTVTATNKIKDDKNYERQNDSEIQLAYICIFFFLITIIAIHCTEIMNVIHSHTKFVS